jgi:VIT1/CCC1 family predicted Fe2+/Mn2+ transporter
VRRWKVKRQVVRKQRAKAERIKLSSRIFSESRSEWLARGTSPAVVDALEREYPPREARILPTRLGNVLRGAEDRLRNSNGDLAGFVLRNRGRVSARIQQQHDQFRARLDMYCTLVLVCSLIAVAYPVTLLVFAPVGQPWAVVAVAVACALMAVVSYRAAVPGSSARDLRPPSVGEPLGGGSHRGAASECPYR